MLDFGFDLVDALDGSAAALCAMASAADCGNDAVFGEDCAGGRLNLQPAAVLVVLGPDAAHRGAGVALDQKSLLESAFSYRLMLPTLSGNDEFSAFAKVQLIGVQLLIVQGE